MKIYFQLLLLLTITFQSAIHDEIIKRSILQHIIEDYPEFKQPSLSCTSCKSAMRGILSFSQTKFVSFVKTQFGKLCPKVETEDICSGINQTFIDQFLSHFLNHYLDPANACARIGVCEYTYQKQTLDEFIEKYLNKDKLVNQQQWIQVAKSKIENNQDFNILHLADLHVDLEYQVGTNIECPNGFCCRQESGMAEDTNKGAQYWGTRAACDVPLRTISNLLEYASEEIKPDFIIWTGDSAAHDVWHQQASNQTLPTRLITDEIKKIMPDTQLYGIFGNHEAFPADQYDVTGDDHKWLRDELAEMWSGYLTQESYNTLKEKGYYAQSDRQRNLKLIALNSQVCDNYNFYLFDHITDPTNQLDWLYQELLKSENQNQFAFIFAHIPPGDNSCHSQWSQRFSVIIERFEHVVTGLFYGHTHSDHIQHIRSQIDGRYLKPVFIVPSGTTHEYQNPSFRIFEIDGLDNQVKDYVQYRLDLDQANKEGQQASFHWYPAYRFTSAYNLDSAKLAQTKLLPQLLMNNDILFTEYIYNYVTGSDILYEKILKDLRNPLYTLSTKKYYTCSAENGVFEDWFNCVGLIEKLKENSFISRKIFDLLGGNWRNENLQ